MTATTILAGVLVVAFAAAGAAKLAAVPAMRARAAHVGMSVAAYRRIGILEILGVLGLLVGALVPVIGALAAAGLLLLLGGAVIAHLRSGDGPRELLPAIVLGLTTLAFLILAARRPPMSRTQRTRTDPIPVIIVGAGPVGLTAATLLGQYGVHCLVLDRWEGVYPQPRAVHLDDEIYRILARLGIAEQFAAVSRPTRGLQLIDRNHRVFAVLDRAGDEGRHGHPQGEHVRPAGTRAPVADQPQGPDHGRPARKRRGHRRRPGRPGTGAGRLHRPAHRPARIPAGRLRPRLRRSQQHRPRGHRLDHAGPHVRAALARHRHRHHRRPATSGTVSTRSATPTGPRRSCGSARPATAGSSGCCRARPRPTTKPSRTCCR